MSGRLYRLVITNIDGFGGAAFIRPTIRSIPCCWHFLRGDPQCDCKADSGGSGSWQLAAGPRNIPNGAAAGGRQGHAESDPDPYPVDQHLQCARGLRRLLFPAAPGAAAVSAGGEIFAETRRLRGGYGYCRENRLLVAASMRWLQYGGVAGSAACACTVCGAYSGVQGRDGGGSARLKPYLICICLLPIPKCNMILVARV